MNEKYESVDKDHLPSYLLVIKYLSIIHLITVKKIGRQMCMAQPSMVTVCYVEDKLQTVTKLECSTLFGSLPISIPPSKVYIILLMV